jgi:tRNA/rRNA methyltransferase
LREEVKTQTTRPNDEAGAREPASSAPSVILMNPQLGENIGFAARAMANFGLEDLRLVAPRDGWPNDKAHSAAAGAYRWVEHAKLYPDLEQAVGQLNFLLATTARPRDMVKPVFTPEQAMAECVRRISRGEACGILFGPERSGLDNDSIALADAVITAPVNPDFASLSLPQTVLLVAYEWLKQSRGEESLGRATAVDGPARPGTRIDHTRPAKRQELFALFEHLERELDRAGFLRPAEKRPVMVRNIRNMFHRMGATEQDVNTWRGIISALAGPSSKGPDEG